MPEISWGNLTFAHPQWLYALAAVPLLAGWMLWRARRRGGLRYSSVATARQVTGTLFTRLTWVPAVLRLAALTLVVLALARPQERNVRRERSAEGVDIVLVLDTSTSMRAMDFTPNRFEAARDVAAEFVRSRASDRVGLIVFAAQAYTQTPLTLDYDFLLRMLRQTEMGVIEDGTAIGTAIAMAVSRLKDSEATSKVAIVLTDGQNNRGEIDPETASEIAQTLGVRVYTIGVGARGEAPFPFDTPFGVQQQRMVPVDIDEGMLRRVAERTGGQYFRATNKNALRQIYDEIGELEKTELEERSYTDYAERYDLFLWPALALVLLEVLLTSTRLRSFP